MQTKIQVSAMLHNAIYQCRIDGKLYNANEKKLYSVLEVKGVIPQAGQVMLDMVGVPVCEDCWKANLGKGLNFTEPSKIFVPPTTQLSKLNNIKK